MSDAVGLDPAGREHVAGLLSGALDRLTEAAGPDRIVEPEAAADICLELFARVDAYGSPDRALFELAAACVEIIGGGVAQRDGRPLRYIGHGRTEMAANPGTPLEYTAAQFGSAVMAGDRAAAWRLWEPLAPGDGPHVRQDTADFLTMLVRNAYSRRCGGQLLVRVDPGKRWPPDCDFCCSAGASRWMWHVVGSDITIGGSGAGPVALRLDDFEYWYACDGCRKLVAVKRPQWEPVWARHRRNRPDSERGNVMTMFRLFERLRRHVMPVVLPAQRPQPTPGRM